MKTHDQLEAEQLKALNALLPDDISLDSLAALATLPVMRKGALLQAQADNPPFGAVAAKNVATIFQSPGPIYEPGGTGPDWWRFGRFLTAMGFVPGDIAQNTFAYHFTPAGAMFESGARAIGVTVFPAGPGNTRQQAEVAATIGTTAYVGTPDYLGAILAKGDELGLDLSRIKRAAVTAGPLFPKLRQAYEDRGILCRQCYGTADVGLIAYETADSIDGMVIDDDVIVEIVTPGTGTPVAPGEIGEVVVTVLNPDYPLLRFSVGDLSAIMPATSGPKRIVGWRGRADQAAKVKGMFIRPEQVASLMTRHPEIHRARVEIGFDGTKDVVTLKVETEESGTEAIAASAAEILKLRTQIVAVAKGDLPRDGVLVDDQRPVEN
ncbi:phenylacetate--CoA ligase family protein [Yoonia maritima]|uniref:phenylacetate--CoA ligase family protein n=1 Tax=Yoonia maritima TaxID=1435347 RepID=UPI0037367F0D